MTEPRAPYASAADHTWIIERITASLARSFALWQACYPFLRLDEETLRRVCQDALSRYAQGGDVKHGDEHE